jgi:hypothetical protein
MISKSNLLKVLYPNIYNDWDDELNKGRDKNKITVGSSKFLIDWKCKICNYKWKQKVSNRVKFNTKCFKCENKEKLLEVKYPSLFSEIDLEMNKFDISNLLIGSSKKINWKCNKCNYKWIQSIDTRIKLKTECYICKNKNKLLINTNPELIDEWDIKKNNTIEIKHLLNGSNKKVWWLCKNCSHSFNTDIYNRAIKKSKCPNCRIRRKNKSPFLEARPDLIQEWDYVLNKAINPNNYSSGSNKKAWWICIKCKNSYECQIYEKVKNSGCPYCRGIKINNSNSIEITHPYILKEWDYEKNNLINLFPNEISKGSNKIANWKCKYGHTWQAKIYNRTKKNHTTCPICIGRKAIERNSFGKMKPELLNEWDYEKNIINPYAIRPGSHTIIYWKCKNEHSWSTPLYSRSLGSFSCPFCSNRYTTKENSVGFLDPKFMEEWDEIKNRNLDPYSISIKSDIKAWWRCNKDEKHSWKTSISHRFHGTNCPYCSSINIILNKYFNKYGLNNKNIISLYKIIIFNKDECFYKIGITKNSIEKRYNRLYQETGYKILIIETKDGLIEDIINEEQITHKNSNKKNDSNLEKYNPKIKFGGKSECYILPSKFEIIKEQLLIDFENYDNIIEFYNLKINNKK